MADNNKGFDPKIFIKNLTKSIQDYSALQAERTKIQGSLIANQIRLKQNWLFKLQEMQIDPQYQMQQRLGQMYQQQQRGGQTVTPETDVFGGQVQPQVRIKGGKYDLHYPSQKEHAYSLIQLKKKKGIALNEKEQKFEQAYLGIKEKGVTAHQQREADIRKNEVLEILNRGTWFDKENRPQTFKNREEATEYIMAKYDVDITDPDIQQALAQYKPTEEIIDEPSWFEKVFQRQKYPQKTLKGYIFEQRPDEKTGKLMWFKKKRQ